MAKNVHKCNHCKFRTTIRTLMVYHVRKKHQLSETPFLFNCLDSTLEKFKCNPCDLVLSYTADVRRHYQHHHIEQSFTVFNFKCKKCPFSSHSKLLFEIHQCDSNWNPRSQDVCSYMHQNHYFKCKTKGKPNRPSKDVHSFECASCQFKAKTGCDLKRHILHRHTAVKDINWFQCEICPFKSKTKSELNRHILYKHTAVKDIHWVLCANCSFQAKTRSELKRHILYKHTAEEDIHWFQCANCQFKAKTAGNLKSHIFQKHTDVKDICWFHCENCQFKAKTARDLRSHIFHIHDNDTHWFKCENCQFKSKRKTYLNKHIRSKHTV